MGHRVGLTKRALGAGIIGVLIAVAGAVLGQRNRWFCDGSTCPDGAGYMLRALVVGSAVACVVFGIAVSLMARRIAASDRAPLAVAISRMAAVLIGLPGLVAVLFGLRGAKTILAYGLLFGAAAAAPWWMRRHGKRSFLLTCAITGVGALILALIVREAAPLLVTYAGLVFVATGIGMTSDASDDEPFGGPLRAPWRRQD